MDRGAGGPRARPAPAGTRAPTPTGLRPKPARALVGLFVPAGLAAASAVLGWASSAPIAAVRAPGPAPVDALLALGAALGCATLLALASIGATLSLAAALTGRVAGRLDALARLLTPRLVRAAVGLAVGATVVGGPVAVASSRQDYPVTVPVGSVVAGAVTVPGAVTLPGPNTVLSARATVTSPSAGTRRSSGEPARHLPALPPGWNPDRPAAAGAATRTPAAEPVTAEARRHSTMTAGAAEPEAGSKSNSTSDSKSESKSANRSTAVVVHSGDTLWAIAARRLGAGARTAQVAAEWPRWHAANRSTIGADPDLILPGQRLQVPPSRPPERHQPIDRQEPP